MWQWIALGCALLAGVGVKGLIDWFRPSHAPQHKAWDPRPPVPVPEPRKVLEFDDTMDLLGAAYVAGQQSSKGNPFSLRPSEVPVHPPGVVHHDKGGWISGPSLAPGEPDPWGYGWHANGRQAAADDQAPGMLP